MEDAEVKAEFERLHQRYLDQGYGSEAAERMVGRSHYLPERPAGLHNEMVRRQQARYHEPIPTVMQ